MKFLIFIAVILFAFLSSTNSSSYFDKQVWVFWHQDINKAPFIVQLCYEKMKSVCKEEKWKLTRLDKNNYKKYIGDVEKFSKARKNTKHPKWNTQFSDHLRLAVIKKNGGVWFDISTFLFKGLKWLQNIQKYPYLLTNSQIQNNIKPNAIIPYLSFYQSKSQKRDQNGRITNMLPGYEAWFIAAKKNSSIISEWLDRFQMLIQKSTTQNNNYQRKNGHWTKFINGDYLNVDKAIHQVIESKQLQLDKNLTVFGERVNANKFYKIIGMHGQYGPYAVYLELVPNKDIVMTHSAQQIAQKYYIDINFFLKFTNNQRRYYQSKIKTLIQLHKQYEGLSDKFDLILTERSSYEDCKLITFIVQGSIFHQLINNNPIAKKKGIQSISKSQYEKWQSMCNQKYKKQEESQHIFDVAQFKQNQLYTNIYMNKFLNRLVHSGYISGQQRQCWSNYISKKNGMGNFGDVEKMYYWKLMHQTRTQQMINKTHLNSEYNKLLQKNISTTIQKLKNIESSSQMSSLQRQVFYLKLWILSERKYIKKVIELFEQYATYIIKASLVSFSALVGFNLIIIVLFLIFSFSKATDVLKEKIRNRKQLYTKKIMTKINNFLQIKQTEQKIIFTIVQLKEPFKGLISMVFLTIVRIFFLLFNAYIVMKFNQICIDGDSDFQEFTLLKIMIIQILFRKLIFNYLSQKVWFLPGIRFQQAYKIFLPLYFFYFGSCPIQFAQKRQANNFAVAFPICFIMPILFQQIQFQAKKIYTKRKVHLPIDFQLITSQSTYNRWLNFNFNFSNLQIVKIVRSPFLSLRQKVLNGLLYLLSKMTNLAQIAVFGFLVSLNILPNIRYLVVDEKYMVKVLYLKIWELGMAFFWLLVIFYIVCYAQLIKSLIKQHKNQRQVLKADNLQFRSTQSSLNSLTAQSISNKQSLNNHNQRSSTQFTTIGSFKLPSLIISNIYNICIILLTTLKLIINIFSIYVLLIQPLPEMVIKNYQIIRKIKLTSVLLLVCINYQLEKFLQLSMYKACYKKDKLTQGNRNQLFIDDEDDKENTNQHHFYINFFQKTAHLYQNNPFAVILTIMLSIFQLLRLYIIQKVYLYIQACQNQLSQLKDMYLTNFDKNIELLVCGTLIGYGLIRVGTNYLFSKKDPEFFQKDELNAEEQFQAGVFNRQKGNRFDQEAIHQQYENIGHNIGDIEQQ